MAQQQKRKVDMMLKHKIQLLEMQLQEYEKRQQQHKALNNMLIQTLQKIQAESTDLDRQKDINAQLKSVIKQMEIHYEEMSAQNDEEINKLKEQLDEKNDEIEKLQSQRRQILVNHQKEIREMQLLLDQKTQKLRKYEDKMHDLAISKLQTQQEMQSNNFRQSYGINDLGNSILNYTQSKQTPLQNRQNFSSLANKSHINRSRNQSMISTSQNRSQLTGGNRQEYLIAKAQYYSKKDKKQLKQIMGVLKKAQKIMTQSVQDVSTIDKSMRMTKSRFN